MLNMHYKGGGLYNMSRIIQFNSKRKQIKLSAGKDFSEVSYLQFSKYDVSCIKDALLYFSGVILESQNNIDEEMNFHRKEFLLNLVMKINVHEKDELSSFIFNNEEVGCLSEALLHYSSFVGIQAESMVDNSENVWAKKRYILKLYSSISEHFKLE